MLPLGGGGAAFKIPNRVQAPKPDILNIMTGTTTGELPPEVKHRSSNITCMTFVNSGFAGPSENCVPFMETCAGQGTGSTSLLAPESTSTSQRFPQAAGV